MFRRIIFILLLLAFGLFSASAQDITPLGEDVDPNFNVSFPPPVYTLRGTVPIVGTVNLPNMANYFIEFRELELPSDDPAAPPPTEEAEERPWFPATLPSGGTPVLDGVIGEWNTNDVPDGLYEIRLTVNIPGSNARFFRVSPLRVENDIPEFLETTQPTLPGAGPTPTQIIELPPRPTLGATPTQLNLTPRVEAVVDANVRQGDSTRYPRIGALLDGESADIIGISSTGSGWYYIQLSTGRRGFISPSTVRVEGNTANLQRINPPPPPATPTPTPTATPVNTTNLRITGFELQPATPVCNEEYNVFVNIFNDGPNATASSFNVTAVDTHVASGTQAASNTVSVPAPLNSQANFLVVIPLRSAIFYSEEHRVTVTIDSGGVIGETDESDNTRSATFVLAQGACGS